MSQQEIFDKVWTGLKGQGFERSVNKENRCVYRGQNGLKCAAGHVLPDEKYDVDYDNGNGYNVTAIDWFTKTFSIDELNLLHRLQQIHDQDGRPEGGLEAALRDYAKEEELTIND